MVNWRRTVCARSDCDDNGQRPVEDESEENERDDNVDKCRNDIEQDKLCVCSSTEPYRSHESTYFKSAVDSCTSVKNPQHLPCLATDMER